MAALVGRWGGGVGLALAMHCGYIVATVSLSDRLAREFFNLTQYVCFQKLGCDAENSL